MQHDICLILREMQSGIGSKSFPELDWVLHSGRHNIIFCKTIALGFRLASYLWQHAKSIPEFLGIEHRIRLYNSLNWPSYNAETLGFLNNNSNAAITIATDVLSIGWDSPNTEDAIILDEPDNVNEFVQKIGQVGRHAPAELKPCGILYYTWGSLTVAHTVLNHQNEDAQLGGHGPDLSNPTVHTHTPTFLKKDKEDSPMDASMACLLLAPCKPAALDHLYNNPNDDIPCTCNVCAIRPWAQRPQSCNCSGCQPDVTPEISMVTHETTISSKAVRKPCAKCGEGITKEMREFGTSELEKLQLQLFRGTSHFFVNIGFLPPATFLPDKSIKEIIDRLYGIQNAEDVSHLLGSNNLLLDSTDCHQQIFQACLQLCDKFAKQHIETAQKRKEQIAPTGDTPTLDVNDILNGDLEVDDAGSGDGKIQLPATKVKLKINARFNHSKPVYTNH